MSLRYFVYHAGSYVELEDGAALEVGRDASCELRLDDVSVSRRHCRIERAGGRCFVVDDDSRHGVLVNGEKVQGSTRLHHGDVLVVGGRHLSFSVRRQDPRSPAAYPRFGEAGSDEDSTATGWDPIRVFAEGAREALLAGDLFLAEMGTRNLLRALRTLGARGQECDAQLGRLAVDLSLELADRTGEDHWLDEADGLTSALRLELPNAVLQRGRALRVRTA